MKIILIIISLLLITAGTLYLFINPENSEIGSMIAEETNWTEKDREIITRLLSVPIILYHDIDGKGDYSIDCEVLRNHFQILKDSNVKVIPLSELVDRLYNPEPFDEKVAVITFDDGYLSAYTLLLPIVKEYGYPVTLFVYTDNISSKSNTRMTWKRLKKMEESGIEIECHSISHADLEALSSKDTSGSRRILFEEIYLSKRITELYMDKKIKFFAFPYGRYNLELIGMCRNSGYLRTFSTDYYTNIITRNNFCLRRGHIKKDFSLDFIKNKIR